MPLRTLIDPTSGAESTVETYAHMGVVVPPIVCQEANSYPNAEGAACMCTEGYFRSEYEGGGWSCERCVRGQMPVDQGKRCESCPFGRYSSSGQGCENCPAGQEPNRDIAADDCVPCNDVSISTPGAKCNRCPTEQVADSNRTKCVCPRDTYNSSTFSGNAIQCLADYHLATLMDIPATEPEPTVQAVVQSLLKFQSTVSSSGKGGDGGGDGMEIQFGGEGGGGGGLYLASS
eukprot:COSAG04_NODE_44_length_31776_cov_9.320769_7_plen_232_part_00